jgi:hypothetical protein
MAAEEKARADRTRERLAALKNLPQRARRK